LAHCLGGASPDVRLRRFQVAGQRFLSLDIAEASQGILCETIFLGVLFRADFAP
jgi:hypothetical protein